MSSNIGLTIFCIIILAALIAATIYFDRRVQTLEYIYSRLEVEVEP